MRRLYCVCFFIIMILWNYNPVSFFLKNQKMSHINQLFLTLESSYLDNNPVIKYPFHSCPPACFPKPNCNHVEDCDICFLAGWWFLAYHNHNHHDSSRATDQHPGDIGQLHTWSNQSRFIFILSGYIIRLRGVN